MPDHATIPEPAGSADPAIDDLYHDIVQHHARDVLGSAASTIADGGSIDESGMLRIVLARLLLHEPNVSQLAARAATLANAVSRLEAAQRKDDANDDLQQELDALIDANDAVRAAALVIREGAAE